MKSQGRNARSRLALQFAFLALCATGTACVEWQSQSRIASIARERARLGETVAVTTTALLQREDFDALRHALDGVKAAHPELLSIGLRSAGGEAPVVIGSHADWQTDRPDAENQFLHSLISNETVWGTLEIRFAPIPRLVGWARLASPGALAAIGFFGLLFLLLRTALNASGPAWHADDSFPPSVRMLLDELSEGLLVFNQTGHITYANSAFCELVGKPPETLKGKRPEVLPWILPPDEGIRLPWTVAMHEEKRVENVILHLRNLDGKTTTLRVGASPLYGTGGAFAGIVAGFDDITLFEQYKLDLGAARDAAETASRTKSEFLANISHEIRTPMNAILGFTDVLRRGLAESRQHAVDYLNTIHSSGTHLLSLINDVLDLSKIEAGHLQIETLDSHPHELLHDVVNVLSVKAREKSISLEYDSAGPIPECIQSDPTRLRQILMNLVGNALKFTEKGGVRVHAALDATNAKAPVLRIDITDSGVGMSEKVIGGLFEAFVQADSTVTRKFGGTGLGLVISRRYARALGGDIVVTSEPGRGSTFSLRLPTGSLKGVRLVTAEDALVAIRQRQQTRNANPLSVRLKPCRVLVVDDGEANRMLIGVLLKRAGATVEQAVNGQEAVDIVAMRDFDVVLMDMQMPVKDGYTATRELREHNFRKPIIALTGHAMTGDDEKCFAAGCTDFLTKPVDIDVLLNRIADIVGRAEPTGDFVSGPVTGQKDLSTSGIRMPPPAVTRVVESTPPAIEPSASPVENVADPQPKNEPTEDLRREFSKPALRLFANERPRRPVPAAKGDFSGTPRPLVSRLPMDDPEFREIVTQFVSRLAIEHRKMIEDLHPQGFSALARRAHWLKGAGGTVGFPELTEPAQTLEDCARNMDAPGAAQAIRRIGELLAAIVIPQPEPIA